MYKRIMVMGDIHGRWDKFWDLWEKINFQPQEDFLIFLGDYVDRGKESARVLDWMCEQQKEKNIVMLRGNHEQMMLDYCKNPDYEINWLMNGGGWCRNEIERLTDEHIKTYLEFIKNRPLFHRMKIKGRDYFFCHAGVRPGVPLDKQREDDLLWLREEFFDYYEGETMIVVGHTPMMWFGREAKPWHVEGRNILMVDTGSYFLEGCISCVDLLSGELWQSHKG